MSRQPEVLWAQRSDKVYPTVSLPDSKDISVNLEPDGRFSFSAVGDSGEPFYVTLQLYSNIAPPQNLASDYGFEDDAENEESSDGEWMLYLPDLEKARGN